LPGSGHRWLLNPDVGSVQHHDDMETCGPNFKAAQAAQGFPLARREEAQCEEDAGRGYPERSLRGPILRPRFPGAGRDRGRFSQGAVEEILGKLSYSSTFLDAATRAAAEKSIKHAYWALAQYDFVYKPQPRRRTDEGAPLFLGVFDWNDSEDDEVLAAWARGEG
jgi:hypothetical protein